MSDKRRNRRVKCLVPVDAKSGSDFDSTQTINISKNGLGIICDHQVKLNKRIAIELDLNEKDNPIFVIGRVKWVSPLRNSHFYRVGIFFEQILDGSKSRLLHHFKA